MTDKTCTVDGCTNPVLAKGFCSKHYNRNHKYGSPHTVKFLPREGVCSEDGCNRPIYSRGLCHKHYQRQRKADLRAAVAELRRRLDQLFGAEVVE